jgi:hypothetical protein
LPPRIVVAVAITVSSAAVARADENGAVEKRLDQLEADLARVTSQVEEDELAELLREAEAEAEAPMEEERPEERQFLWGALALQKLNPEISLSADIVGGLILRPNRFYAGENDRSGMPVREVSLHLQHVLDPYSMFKSAFSFSPEHGAELEEIYITWFGLLESLSVTVGRFRQGFGVINRWHEHDLDQVQYPLALQQTLGEEGLAGSGVSVKWFLPPLWAHANELTLEVTSGENEALFAGEHFSIPSTLAHIESYYDLTPSTYAELGLTGMVGFNNRRGVPADAAGAQRLVDEPWRETWVAGADLTLQWTPPQQARYRSLTWRSEAFWVAKQRGPSAWRRSWGAYSYLDYQLAERWFAGVRGDVALPTERESQQTTWDVVPYLTFWQSEYVYVRLQYAYTRRLPVVRPGGELVRRDDNRVLLQIDFAAGPHKHEKY